MRKACACQRFLSVVHKRTLHRSAKMPMAQMVSSDAMKDEYGTMDSSGQSYIARRFTLESG
jgi:hypothetical protein